MSFCPLCASGVVFDRRKDGRRFDFGNTGRIRHYDMVMYDHQTESFWQQFLGEAIVGELTGVRLDPMPSRLESLDRFRARAPEGQVLVPNTTRRCGPTGRRLTPGLRDPRRKRSGVPLETVVRLVARSHAPDRDRL